MNINLTAMKTKIIFFLGFFLLHWSVFSYCNNISNNKIANSNNHSFERLIILCSPDIYTITSKWAIEYNKLNPEISIEINQFTGTPKAALSNKGTDLYFISDESFSSLNPDSIWKMMVGYQVIVPVINSKNPFLDRINKQGVSAEEMAQIFNNPGKRTWGNLLGNSQNTPVHYYVINDVSIQTKVVDFLDSDQDPVDGIIVKNPVEMITAIQKDPYGIGFCRLTDVVATDNRTMVKNIKLLPIDKNKNKTLDYFENIYNNLNDFVRGVWIGKYPKALCKNIYSVSSSKPSDESALRFLTWVITGGQQFLNPVGNNDLQYSVRQAKKLDLLTVNHEKVSMLTDTGPFSGNLNGLSIFSLIAIALIPFILAIMIRDALLQYKRQKNAALPAALDVSSAVFNENSVETPKGLYFDKTHMWAFMEKNGTVLLGIDDFLQHITGPITRAVMKNPGEKIKKGEQILSIIRNGKHLNIYAPVSGTIKEQNKDLLTKTSIINSSPYNEGWVYMIEPANWLWETQFLTMAEKNKEWLKNEFTRLKDFLAFSLKSNADEYSHIVLQDGGEIREGVLADLGPRVWEDFQTNFIDASR